MHYLLADSSNSFQWALFLGYITDQLSKLDSVWNYNPYIIYLAYRDVMYRHR